MDNPFLIKTISGSFSENTNHANAITAPSVSGYTFRFWVAFASDGWANAIYSADITRNPDWPWTSTYSENARAFHAFALYTKDV